MPVITLAKSLSCAPDSDRSVVAAYIGYAFIFCPAGGGSSTTKMVMCHSQWFRNGAGKTASLTLITSWRQWWHFSPSPPLKAGRSESLGWGELHGFLDRAFRNNFSFKGMCHKAWSRCVKLQMEAIFLWLLHHPVLLQWSRILTGALLPKTSHRSSALSQNSF